MFSQEVKGHQEPKGVLGQVPDYSSDPCRETLRDGFLVCSWFVCQYSSSGTISYLKDWKKYYLVVLVCFYRSFSCLCGFLEIQHARLCNAFTAPCCSVASCSHTQSLHSATLTPFNLAQVKSEQLQCGFEQQSNFANSWGIALTPSLMNTLSGHDRNFGWEQGLH